MAPCILFELHVLILREHVARLGFVSRLQPPFRKRKYVGYPNMWLSSESGFASKPKIITYRNSRTSGLDTFGEMCTTNRLPLTGYMQRRFCFVIHLNVSTLQKIYFGKRCVSKYLCRVLHTSHHNKLQASSSKQICCELVMCVNSEQALPPLRQLSNYLSTWSWSKILFLNRHKFTHAG